jgi:hypothetical protein
MTTGEAVDYIWSGIRVRSTIPLRFPVAAGDQPAGVRVELGAVPGRPLSPERPADFFVESGDLVLVVRGVGRFLASGGTRVIVDAEPGATEEDLRLYVSGSVLGAIALQRGQLPLHASAVEIRDGECVAFTGLSGAGKSSLAAHFTRSGHRLVADDVCVLAERDDGYAVWPGPSRIKLAPDALASLRRDSSGLEPTGGTREKYHFDVGAGRVASMEPVRLSAIFLLAWGEGSPRAVPMTGLDAIDAIGGHTYRQEFVRPLGLEADWLRAVAKVARNVPLYRLIRPAGHDRAEAVIEQVIAVADEG